MIDPADFLKWLNVFGVPTGGGDAGSVSQRQVQTSAFNYNAATGINDAFVVNLVPAVTAYTDGLLVTMAAGTLQNLTTTPTLAVNALAAKPIETYWGNPAIGDIGEHGTYIFIYNATNGSFELINPTISTANTGFVQYNTYTTASDSGTANAYAAILTPPIPNLNNSLQTNLIIAHANTGASTLTVSGNTANIVLANNVALSGGELVPGQNAFFIYSGTYDAFILLNPANNSNYGYITTATAGATTTLTVASSYQQFFTGTMAQTVVMPVASTVSQGQSWLIVNNSTNNLTVQSSGGNTIVIIAGGTSAKITCILTSGTTAASWYSLYYNPVSGGLAWNTIAGTTQAAVVNNAYVIGNASQTTVSLPAIAAFGSVIAVQGQGAGGFILKANTGQTVQVGTAVTSSGGTVTSSNQYDSIEVVCIEANTIWAARLVYSTQVTCA